MGFGCFRLVDGIGLTEEQRRERPHQFDIKEKGIDGEGLKAFLDRELPELQEAYTLHTVQLELAKSKLFPRRRATAEFSMLDGALGMNEAERNEAEKSGTIPLEMRVEIGMKAKNRDQLGRWFRTTPGRVKQVGYF